MTSSLITQHHDLLRDPNTAEQSAAIEAGAQAQQVKQVTMVYKNHLDVGFTESVAKVTHDAIHWMLGVAMDLDQQLQAIGKRFVWTTPSWVIHEALEICHGAELARIEQGIHDGCLAWHALPFTTHTALLSAEMIDAGLGLSHALDARFGKQMRAAKLTDVPGHALGLVPRLAAAGVELLHIGVNHMSALCDVPPAFRWRHTQTDSEISVFYGSGYGGTHVLDNDDRCLLWRMVGDNCEVPSLEDIVHDYRSAQQHFPDAQIQVGRVDDYLGNDFRQRTRNLPLIDQDLGDSWIHGTGSDPYKTQRFRALQRLAQEWLQEKRFLPHSKSFVDFGKNINLIAEHTWGVNFNAHNHHNRSAWAKPDFQNFRKRGAIQVIEGSWQEQRDYIDFACEALPADLHEEAQQALAACKPVPYIFDEWHSCDNNLIFKITDHIQLHLDDNTGAIAQFLVDEQERCNGLLGNYTYQSFDQHDCRRFCQSYNRGPARIEEFTKMGLEHSPAQSKLWSAQRLHSWFQEDDASFRIVSALALDQTASEVFGAPRKLYLEFSISKSHAHIDCTLQWFDKDASRLPEASWWSFHPLVASSTDWEFHACGQWQNPHDCVKQGGRELFAVERGARNKKLCIESFDAHLIAPGRRQLYRFNEGDVDCSDGLHFNLHNNCWGTNFVMWIEDDCRFRSRLSWD